MHYRKTDIVKNERKEVRTVSVTVRVDGELAARVVMRPIAEDQLDQDVTYCCEFCLVGAHASLLNAAEALHYIMFKNGLAFNTPEGFLPDDDEPPF